MVDLRSTASPAAPSVEVQASAGAELLRFIGVVLSPSPDTFDVGADRIAALRERIPDALLDEARALSYGLQSGDDADTGTGDDKAFLVLTLLGALLEPPHGTDELCALLEADPGIAWRLMVAGQLADLLDDPTELRSRVLRNEPGVRDELEALDLDCCAPAVRRLLVGDPDDYGRRLGRVVEGFASSVWPTLTEESMGPIERDVAHRRALLDSGVPPAEVVLEATNGYELADEPAGRRVVLLPSYWLRPWLVVGDIDVLGIEVVSTVVGDAFLALPPEAPPPALLKLFKALSDEGRLTLLRRMITGPVSLAEATEALGVAKATAHHHLSILRQAGLVTLRGEGRSARYALRDDPAELAHAALRAYVPTRR